MGDYKKIIFDLFFPISCLGCGQQGKFICAKCFNQIPLNKEKHPQPVHLNKLLVASDYEYPLIKQAIHCYKYDFVKDLAEPLAELMIKKLNKQLTNEFILIPVPLHQKRLRWRGFNQAELLSQEISRKLKIPMANDILNRTKYHPPQVKIQNPQQRKENVSRAFQISRPVDLKNKIIILIDDVCTSGATLSECALTLKPLRAKAVWGLVIARG